MINLRTAAGGRMQVSAKEMCRYLAFQVVEVVQAVQRVTYGNVSQPPGRGPLPGPGINCTGPREA